MISPSSLVGGAVISAEDVAAEARRLRAAGQPAGDAQAVLQALILREAMLQEASTSTWANAQEARRAPLVTPGSVWPAAAGKVLIVEGDAVRLRRVVTKFGL